MKKDKTTMGRPVSARTDLGLALLEVLRKPGQCLTKDDIAAWCDCTRQNINRIEQRALKKLRAVLRRGENMPAAELSVSAPRKTVLNVFTKPVVVRRPARREMPFKQWVSELAAKEGVTDRAIYMRLYRRPESMPRLRRVNARVLMVQLEAA